MSSPSNFLSQNTTQLDMTNGGARDWDLTKRIRSRLDRMVNLLGMSSSTAPPVKKYYGNLCISNIPREYQHKFTDIDNPWQSREVIMEIKKLKEFCNLLGKDQTTVPEMWPIMYPFTIPFVSEMVDRKLHHHPAQVILDKLLNYSKQLKHKIRPPEEKFGYYKINAQEIDENVMLQFDTMFMQGKTIVFKGKNVKAISSYIHRHDAKLVKIFEFISKDSGIETFQEIVVIHEGISIEKFHAYQTQRRNIEGKNIITRLWPVDINRSNAIYEFDMNGKGKMYFFELNPNLQISPQEYAKERFGITLSRNDDQDTFKMTISRRFSMRINSDFRKEQIISRFYDAPFWSIANFSFMNRVIRPDETLSQIPENSPVIFNATTKMVNAVVLDSSKDLSYGVDEYLETIRDIPGNISRIGSVLGFIRNKNSTFVYDIKATKNQ